MSSANLLSTTESMHEIGFCWLLLLLLVILQGRIPSEVQQLQPAVATKAS
jgi:hypothetical protein